jgi:hypothetical protein
VPCVWFHRVLVVPDVATVSANSPLSSKALYNVSTSSDASENISIHNTAVGHPRRDDLQQLKDAGRLARCSPKLDFRKVQVRLGVEVPAHLGRVRAVFLGGMTWLAAGRVCMTS